MVHAADAAKGTGGKTAGTWECHGGSAKLLPDHHVVSTNAEFQKACPTYGLKGRRWRAVRNDWMGTLGHRRARACPAFCSAYGRGYVPAFSVQHGAPCA